MSPETQEYISRIEKILEREGFKKEEYASILSIHYSRTDSYDLVDKYPIHYAIRYCRYGFHYLHCFNSSLIGRTQRRRIVRRIADEFSASYVPDSVFRDVDEFLTQLEMTVGDISMKRMVKQDGKRTKYAYA